jgi:hypothetical protein
VSSLEQPSVPTCPWKISSLRDQIGPTNQARFAILVTCCGGGACCELRRCVRRVGWTNFRALLSVRTSLQEVEFHKTASVDESEDSEILIRQAGVNTAIPSTKCLKTSTVGKIYSAYIMILSTVENLKSNAFEQHFLTYFITFQDAFAVKGIPMLPSPIT